MKKLFEPKPLRLAEDWKHLGVIEKSSPTQLATEKLNDAAKITCRDCFGFGHSLKKCPTGRKLDEHRHGNQLLRIVVSRARAKLANKLAAPVAGKWFLHESVLKDLSEIKVSAGQNVVM
jgi:hypothetical protein